MNQSGRYPPPYNGPGTAPHQPPQQSVMVVPHHPMIVAPIPVGPKSTCYTCRSCNQQIMTRTVKKPVQKTHLFALLLCALGCWLCCCIPYCMDSCKSTDHYCPNCHAYIGSYKQ